MISKLLAAKSEEEYLELTRMRGKPEFPVCAKITVRIRGESVQHEQIARETLADNEGKYSFDDLPLGSYEVWAELPSRPASGGPARIAAARAAARVWDRPDFYNRGGAVYRADLDLRTDLVTVRGRVTDANGNPIAGARVIGKGLSEFDSAEVDRMIERGSVAAVTGADGTYELRGLVPPDTYRTAAYLNSGWDGEVARVFEAQAAGFAPTSRQLPLVTEEVLGKSRRMLAALGQLEQRARKTQPSTRPAQIRGEKPGLPLPSSRANTITGLDFILPTCGAAARTGSSVSCGRPSRHPLR